MQTRHLIRPQYSGYQAFVRSIIWPLSLVQYYAKWFQTLQAILLAILQAIQLIMGWLFMSCHMWGHTHQFSFSIKLSKADPGQQLDVWPQRDKLIVQMW